MYRGPFKALIAGRGDLLPVVVTRELPLTSFQVLA